MASGFNTFHVLARAHRPHGSTDVVLGSLVISRCRECKDVTRRSDRCAMSEASENLFNSLSAGFIMLGDAQREIATKKHVWLSQKPQSFGTKCSFG